MAVSPSGAPGSASRVPVLIVDDNAANRLAFASVLAPQNLDVVLASSGKEALARVDERDFAVILLDVRMPIMDGYETAELIRKRKAAKYTPILFTSAFDMTPAQVTKAYVAGAIDYIPSPVDAEVLTLKVSAYIQLYLRDEAVVRALQDLTVSYQALQADMAASVGISAGLQAKVTALDQTIRRLRQELDRCTCGCSPPASSIAKG